MSILNADAPGAWEDRCLRLDTVKLFEGVDRDDPELRAILAPEMARIPERVKLQPESESNSRLVERLSARAALESNLKGNPET